MSTLVVLAIILGPLFPVFDLVVQGPLLAADYISTTAGLTVTVAGGRHLKALFGQ